MNLTQEKLTHVKIKIYTHSYTYICIHPHTHLKDILINTMTNQSYHELRGRKSVLPELYIAIIQ